LGLHAGDPLPIDLAALALAAVVAEIIMIPEETDLLVAARAAGHPVHYGRHMLDHQIRLIAAYIGA
ncbi:MAG: shikimate dehydrogenase, partial [Pseudomonadota bacterium]|nr:shikimate dehydrogenase [Pseudomonadota bacterium]